MATNVLQSMFINPDVDKTYIDMKFQMAALISASLQMPGGFNFSLGAKNFDSKS